MLLALVSPPVKVSGEQVSSVILTPEMGRAPSLASLYVKVVVSGTTPLLGVVLTVRVVCAGGHGMSARNAPAEPVRPRSRPDESAVRLRILGTPSAPMSVGTPVAGSRVTRWESVSAWFMVAYNLLPTTTMPDASARPPSGVTAM